MRPGAERLARVDHEVDRRLAWRLPWRADGERAVEHQRPVELPPPLRPVVGDLRCAQLDERRACRRPQVGKLRQLARGAEHRVLDDLVAELDLLHPARRQLEQLGEHELGVRSPDPDGEPDHPPKARLILPNTPSSVRRLWSVIDSASHS